jgi:cation diffusion facilitator family transporter
MNNEHRSLSDEAVRITRLLLWVNLLLAVFKLISGVFAHSTAVVADAAHSFSDLLTDIIVLLGLHFAARPPDETHQYGHGKGETLGAAVTGLFLMLAGIGIAISASRQLLDVAAGKALERPGWLAFIAAFVSILAKEWMYCVTIRTGRRAGSQAMMANAWHHRSDALSSVAVVIGVGGAILLGESWRVLDPAVALLVSAVIVKVAVDIVRSAIVELLDTSLGVETEHKIEVAIRAVPGVRGLHKLRSRRIGNACAVEVHVQVDPRLTIVEAHDISTAVERAIHWQLKCYVYVSVHVEPYGY